VTLLAGTTLFLGVGHGLHPDMPLMDEGVAQGGLAAICLVLFVVVVPAAFRRESLRPGIVAHSLEASALRRDRPPKASPQRARASPAWLDRLRR
jgi:hypothetical protein